MRFLRGLATGLVVALWIHMAGASRNSAGTMSALNGPYVVGTTIDQAAVNARLADIEAELTDSKSRSGKGDFSAPVRAADGTVAAPAFSWTSETGSGLFRNGTSDVRMSLSGTARTFWNTTGFGVGIAPLWKLHVQLASSGATAIASTSAMIESNGTHFLNLLAPNANSSGVAFGDVTNPSLGYIEYKNSGNGSANQLQFGAAGATKMIIGSGGVTIGSIGTAMSIIQSKTGTTGCSTTNVAGAQCTTTVTWTTTFADSSYIALCQGHGISAGSPAMSSFNPSNASVAIITVATSAAIAQFTTIDCVAIHP